MTVIGWKDWYCDASLAGHGKPWYTDGHPDAIDLAEAESFGKAMVVHSHAISGGQTDIIPKLHSKEASDMVWGIGHPFLNLGGGQPSQTPAGQPSQTPVKTEAKPYPLEIPASMVYVRQLEGLPSQGAAGGIKGGSGGQELKINKDKCIRCGLCVRGCPCNNIDDSVFPYVFITQDCEFCLYCEGICPTGAVEYNFPQRKASAQSAVKTMNVPLALAEATGRFRRLLKEEDVGSKGPWEAVTGHPRHKELP